MFSLLRKKDETTPSPFSQNAREEEARLVIDENGTIVFASAAFLSLANLTTDTIAQHNFYTILTFKDAMFDSPRDLEKGTQEVWINNTSNPHSFHFNWIEMPGSRNFLVGTLHTDDAETDATIQQPEELKPQKPSIKSKTANNNKNIAVQQDFKEDFEIFLNLTREMMVVVEKNGKILRTNQRFSTTTGYNAEELEDILFFDLFENFDLFKNSDDGPYTELHLNTKSKEPLWIEWKKQEHNGLLYFTGRDVTAIKTQHKELRSREKQLTEAENLAHMGHWQWVLGKDSLDWSTQIYDIFGVDKDSFEATLDNMNEMVHPEDVDRLHQSLQRAIIEEKDYDVEFSIIRPDGEERFIRSEGRCSRDENGEVVALFGIMQDMTERMLYERELKSAKNAAERAYAAKTQFLANMSHELRTPLNAIIGFSEMIERQLLGPIGTEKYLDYISGIRESGEHLLDLISDILDMSKIEAGKYELALEEINIQKVIQLAVHMIEGRAVDAGIKVTSHFDCAPETKIIADRRGILQILLNLLSNAVKFSKENGHVDIHCNADDNGIILNITDDGIGIPANKLATITNPFEQVSSSYAKEHEGSGLGLAITKELVELHNGTLHIESEIDTGTTVRITIPYEATNQHTDNHAME